MVAKKPRVVIIGAGMAGLTAARRLVQAADSSLDLVLLEASSKIGGRILTSEIGGNRVELGATWIHGMEGSPLYQIAQDIGATEHTKPFECQDSISGLPVIKAEGGIAVPPSVASPMMDLYKKLLDHVRSRERLNALQAPLSIGTFVADGLHAFFSQESTGASENGLFDCLASDAAAFSWPDQTTPWTMRSLQEALFTVNECMERVETAANTLRDLDLRSEKEYRDYPGEHVTIPGGYTSIIAEIASSLPERLIEFEKKVERIVWNRAFNSSAHPVAVHCGDGSVYEADHVIVTVSLGVLKAGVMQKSTYAWGNLEGRHVCRSVDELLAISENAGSSSLFQPPLPASKIEAVARLGYGLVNKVFLQLNTSVLSPSQLLKLNAHIQLVYKNQQDMKAGAIPWWMRKTVSMSPIYNGSSVLLCWFAGSEALELESLSDEEIMAGVARTLASFRIFDSLKNGKRSYREGVQYSEYSSCSDSEDSSLSSENCLSSSSSSDSEETCDDDEEDFEASEGDYVNMFSGVLRSRWGTDPLFHGSYSFVATGASGDDIETLAAPLPAASDDECHAEIDSFNTCPATDGAFNARDAVLNTNHVPNHGRTCPVCHGEVQAVEAAKDVASKSSQSPLQLLFAGEATLRTLYSTTHGAHLSGLREADRLLCHYA